MPLSIQSIALSASSMVAYVTVASPRCCPVRRLVGRSMCRMLPYGEKMSSRCETRMFLVKCVMRIVLLAFLGGLAEREGDRLPTLF